MIGLLPLRTLRFDRKSLILDGEDNTVKTKTIGKGTKVTVLGLRHEIGRKKSVPHFMGENPEEVVTWLVRLPDGSRAYMEVPEMANVMEGASIRDVAIYYPTRHFKPFVGDMKYEDCTKWWTKALFRLGGPIDFLSSHKARHLLYKDGAFYSYVSMEIDGSAVALDDGVNHDRIRSFSILIFRSGCQSALFHSITGCCIRMKVKLLYIGISLIRSKRTALIIEDLTLEIKGRLNTNL